MAEPLFKAYNPSDTADLPFVHHALRVGGRGGQIRLLVAGVGVRTLRVEPKTVYEVAFRRVFKTGTTVTGLQISPVPPGEDVVTGDALLTEDGETLSTEDGDDLYYD